MVKKNVNGTTYLYNTFVSESIGILKAEKDRIIFTDYIGNVVSATPNNMIVNYFSCRKKIDFILNHQRKYITQPVGKYLIEYLRLALENIDSSKLGVTGSFLFDFQNEKSDIDLVCYGEHAYNELLKLFKGSDFIQGYEGRLQSLIYERRKTHMAGLDKKALVIQESRKLQGIIKGTNIHINCQPLREDEDVIRLYKVTELGKITCEITVTDDVEGKYAPAIYKIKIDTITDGFITDDYRGKIDYLISYLGDYSQLFRKNDRVYLEGKIIRFYLGGKLCFGIGMTSWNTKMRYKAQLII